MRCPKCKHYMKHIEYKGIAIERCTECYGMWFDDFELKDMQAISGSEVIDIGDPELGHKQSLKTKITCPVCGPEESMVSETDKRQAHIRYERCPNCQGVYLDAGEYRDYKELTIGEFFKSLFNKKDDEVGS